MAEPRAARGLPGFSGSVSMEPTQFRSDSLRSSCELIVPATRSRNPPQRLVRGVAYREGGPGGNRNQTRSNSRSADPVADPVPPSSGGFSPWTGAAGVSFAGAAAAVPAAAPRPAAAMHTAAVKVLNLDLTGFLSLVSHIRTGALRLCMPGGCDCVTARSHNSRSLRF